MQLVFVHGPPACGKLTVARELAALTGFRLFHNHLTVDLVMALFDFGTEPFIRLRESIWLDAFAEAATAGQSLIFTFNPEASVSNSFPERCTSVIESNGGKLHFVELICSEDQIERRIENPSRADFGKLRSVSEYRRLRAEGAFAFPPLPAPLLRIDTGEVAADRAARQIASLLQLPGA